MKKTDYKTPVTEIVELEYQHPLLEMSVPSDDQPQFGGEGGDDDD